MFVYFITFESAKLYSCRLLCIHFLIFHFNYKPVYFIKFKSADQCVSRRCTHIFQHFTYSSFPCLSPAYFSLFIRWWFNLSIHTCYNIFTTSVPTINVRVFIFLRSTTVCERQGTFRARQPIGNAWHGLAYWRRSRLSRPIGGLRTRPPRPAGSRELVPRWINRNYRGRAHTKYSQSSPLVPLRIQTHTRANNNCDLSSNVYRTMYATLCACAGEKSTAEERKGVTSVFKGYSLSPFDSRSWTRLFVSY